MREKILKLLSSCNEEDIRLAHELIPDCENFWDNSFKCFSDKVLIASRIPYKYDDRRYSIKSHNIRMILSLRKGKLGVVSPIVRHFENYSIVSYDRNIYLITSKEPG